MHSERVIYFNHGRDIAFRTGEFGGVFDTNQNNEIQVMPHIVLVRDVILITHTFVIKLGPVKT